MTNKFMIIAAVIFLACYALVIKFYGNSQLDKGKLISQNETKSDIIEVQKKYDEIRANRTDNDGLVKRLRQGTY